MKTISYYWLIRYTKKIVFSIYKYMILNFIGAYITSLLSKSLNTIYTNLHIINPSVKAKNTYNFYTGNMEVDMMRLRWELLLDAPDIMIRSPLFLK